MDVLQERPGCFRQLFPDIANQLEREVMDAPYLDHDIFTIIFEAVSRDPKTRLEVSSCANGQPDGQPANKTRA